MSYQKSFMSHFGMISKFHYWYQLMMLLLKKTLSTFEKQVLIKLIEEKDTDKRFIENWRPISLLNTNLKLI